MEPLEPVAARDKSFPVRSTRLPAYSSCEVVISSSQESSPSRGARPSLWSVNSLLLAPAGSMLHDSGMRVRVRIVTAHRQ